MHDELSAGTDGSLISTYHTQSHGIVGSLGDILHQLQRRVQLWRGDQSRLLCTLLKVSEEELVLAYPLDWFDEVGVYAVALLQPFLDLLWVCVCVGGGGGKCVCVCVCVCVCE